MKQLESGFKRAVNYHKSQFKKQITCKTVI